MNRKIFCLMLVIGMIFSVSSVCASDLNDAADLNDTQIIRVDDFIQHDTDLDINCNDNSTDNSSEIDFNDIPEGDMDLNNMGILPVKISYYMEPDMIEDIEDQGLNDYFIYYNYVKAPDVKNLTLHFDVDGNEQLDIKIDDTFNHGSEAILVVSNHENSKYYLPDFNIITVTVSYIIKDKTEFSQMTFEKSDFKPICE